VVVENEITDEASMTKLACEAALVEDFGKAGDNIVIVAGIPFGVSGTTNLLRVVTLSSAVCTEDLIRVDGVMESPKLAE
jgi:pyruvate kinase